MNMTLCEKKQELEFQIENLENLISTQMNVGNYVNIDNFESLTRLQILLDIFSDCDHRSFFSKTTELALGDKHCIQNGSRSDMTRFDDF